MNTAIFSLASGVSASVDDKKDGKDARAILMRRTT